MLSKLKQTVAVYIIRKIQKYGPHRVEVLGRSYLTSENVFNPRYYFTSKFMAEHIKARSEDVVLDLGTGSGIQAITAGETAKRVFAIDINPEAVHIARKNVEANGLDHVISVIEGDLFEPLNKDQKFNIILFTPPYMDGKPEKYFDYALFDPGKELMKRFFREARHYLYPDGYVQMLYSSIARPETVLAISEQLGWNFSLTAREKTVTECFMIYKFTSNQKELKDEAGNNVRLS